MTLEIVAGKPGLWRDPGWTRDMPGVYALVIGVSAYPHLEGGTEPADESYGLGQLISSASTAAKLFHWLRNSFRRQNLPVVWCYLLLSPTSDERTRFEADGLTHYAPPTYANLRTAIQAWTGNVPLNPPASEHSRTLFVFSGHGVQSNRKGVLLPSDYLDPGLGSPDFQNCIGVDDLREWMEENPVAEHIALLDACRNEFSPLASKGASAHGVFPKMPPAGAPPLSAASLAATSPNAVAYQMPGEPLTFFGRAVIEALDGAAGGANDTLEFGEVIDYVQPRVNILLKNATGQPLNQSVYFELAGQRRDFVFAEIARKPGFGFAAPAAASRSFGMAPPDPSAVVQDALRARFEDALEVRDPIRLNELVASEAEAHRRFGHEYATLPWVHGPAEMYALEDGQPCVAAATVQRVKRNEASSIMQVDLALDPRRGGVLLVFQGAEFVERERLAVLLPTDQNERVPVRLTIHIPDAGPGARRPKLQKLEAQLGPSNWNPHYDYLWSLAREADLGSLRMAAKRADPERLKAAAQDKQAAETAAAAGMLLLARVGRIADVQDWTRNLMQWFQWMPDAAVLWAESLRNAVARGEARPYGVADPVAEMLDALAELTRRGVPFFAESLDLAESLAGYLRRAALSDAQRGRLDAIKGWLDSALDLTVPAGNFLLVPGLPRPEAAGGGTGALTVPEILRLLRGPRV
jgi:hypothetical protein